MIEVKEIHSKRELKKFVKFPFKIYKDSKYWVPPLISQEVKTLDKDENPIFHNAEARFFIAYKNNKPVGRVAAIINWIEVNEQKEKKMRFGWFDFIDDLEVSKALLAKVEEIGRENNLEYTEGPVGFSNLDKVGVITEGYDTIPPMVTWYNHSYYVNHYEALGYKKEKAYIESKFTMSDVNPETFMRSQDLIKRRYNIETLNFASTDEVLPYVDKMFDLFNESYSALSSFVKVTDIQKEYFKEKFIKFVNPEYIKFTVDKDDNLIGFAIVMPSFSQALQKAKGKLFPLGFKYILEAKKNNTDAIFYLIGIHPDYQNKGVHALLFNEYYKVFKKRNIVNCYRTPELEDNLATQKIWRHFNPKVFRRRATFRKDLN